MQINKIKIAYVISAALPTSKAYGVTAKETVEVLLKFGYTVKILASSSKYYDSDFEKKRNWHWAWSQIYFYKKHHSSFDLLRICIKLILVSFFKLFFYSLLFSGKRKIYFYRFYGGICSVLNLESFYRNKITK